MILAATCGRRGAGRLKKGCFSAILSGACTDATGYAERAKASCAASLVRIDLPPTVIRISAIFQADRDVIGSAILMLFI
jgi:hypothetical protein